VIKKLRLIAILKDSQSVYGLRLSSLQREASDTDIRSGKLNTDADTDAHDTDADDTDADDTDNTDVDANNNANDADADDDHDADADDHHDDDNDDNNDDDHDDDNSNDNGNDNNDADDDGNDSDDDNDDANDNDDDNDDANEDANDYANNRTDSHARVQRRTNTSICKCAKSVSSRLKKEIAAISTRRNFKDVRSIVKDLEKIKVEIWQEFCWLHLRAFCRGIGLKTNNGGRRRLSKRLHYVRKERYRLGELRSNSKSYYWFRKDARGVVPEDLLGVWAYPALPPPPVVYDSQQVYIRYAGKESWDSFVKDGHTIATGIMSWITNNHRLMKMIRQETEMYQWHRSLVNGNGSFGWLRNYFYSLEQQAARQDPVYYALVCATRPNKYIRLISFPYYMKTVLPGDFTFFRHFDLNLPKYIRDGRGKNRIQTSFSLTQEFENNCTVVIPGFEKHIEEWWKRVVAWSHNWHPPHANRNKATNTAKTEHRGNTTKCDTIYLKEDRKDFGDFAPCLCALGDIVISKPTIPHGSAAGKDKCGNSVRWVVNPWFVGIQADLCTTDIVECGDWSILAAAHRDQMLIHNTPSGQIAKRGHPTERFPGSLEFRGFGALSDALIGLHGWDSPVVLKEAALVLGTDDKAAWTYVNSVRKAIIDS